MTDENSTEELAGKIIGKASEAALPGQTLGPIVWIDALQREITAALLAVRREALEELREPTEAMVDAGCAIEFHCPGPVINTPSKWMRLQWRVMIDTAIRALAAEIPK